MSASACGKTEASVGLGLQPIEASVHIDDLRRGVLMVASWRPGFLHLQINARGVGGS